jgi:hypothetical protein
VLKRNPPPAVAGTDPFGELIQRCTETVRPMAGLLLSNIDIVLTEESNIHILKTLLTDILQEYADNLPNLDVDLLSRVV